MSRNGVVTAPVKCEENLRTPVEIKQEQCDDEDAYGEPHAKHPSDSSTGKPSSSSLSAAEAENSYEFLGNMKYEADESTDLTATALSASRKRDTCPLCQQVYNTKPRTYYGDHRKREFVGHLVKVHDYSHLRGYCRKTQCKGCNAKRERWTFVVREGNNYKFSDMCSRCQECTCGTITDDSGGIQCPKNHHRQSITSLWKDFMAHQESNAEPEECPEATAETPAAAEEPGIRAAEATDLTITEHPSSKKHDGGACQLCQQVYYKKTSNGNKKREFVAHLVKAHNYRHLRGHTVLIQCRRCKIEKERWSFVVGEGKSYKFSEECSTCLGNRRGRTTIASQWKNFMAHQELNAELRECPEAASETPSASDEPASNEAHSLPEQ